MTSSAHEKSIIDTCEKSITVSERSVSPSSVSIWVRTAAPVGRVTRFEYRSADSVCLRTVPRSMWLVIAPWNEALARDAFGNRYLNLRAGESREILLERHVVVPVRHDGDARRTAANRQLPAPSADVLPDASKALAPTWVAK